MRRRELNTPSRPKLLAFVDESNIGNSAGAWLLACVDDVAADLFVALQL
jgi:hypothetical protein